jgi:hypothetical protein
MSLLRVHPHPRTEFARAIGTARVGSFDLNRIGIARHEDDWHVGSTGIRPKHRTEGMPTDERELTLRDHHVRKVSERFRECFSTIFGVLDIRDHRKQHRGVQVMRTRIRINHESQPRRKQEGGSRNRHDAFHRGVESDGSKPIA